MTILKRNWLTNTKCQTITQLKKGLLMNQIHSHGLTLLVSLFLCLAFPLYSNAETIETVTGQETTSNLLPGMGNFTTSGATKSQKAGNGCTTTAFCTGGQQGPGGTFTSTFDLSDGMTKDQINRGFDMDYDVDVKSHPSNANLASCTAGNIMQAQDCRDIFALTVSLFDSGSLKHKFEHQVELDFSGLRNFAFSQTIPQNTYSGLTGEFELFGIDAGFPNKFFGPQFSNPSLTTTFDLVTIIEMEVVDIINDIIETELPPDTSVTDVSIEVVPVEQPTEMASLEISVETEINTELELPSMTVDTNTPQPEVNIEVADVSSELEMEMNVNADTTSESMESTQSEVSESGANTQDTSSEGSESTTEGESTEQAGESEGEVDGNNTSSNEETSEETQTANDDSGEEESSSDAGPDRVDNSKKAEASSNKGNDKNKSPKKSVKKVSKQKAAKKILSKMGDKGRYDSTNQLKTLIVMNVLGNQKSFIDPTKVIPDTPGFFTDKSIPDSNLSDNNYTSYFLFGGDDASHNALINSQYK